MIDVEQTRMTSLIEITVKNPEARSWLQTSRTKIAYWYKRIPFGSMETNS